MAQFLISVWHDDDYDPAEQTTDMERIGPKVDALNEQMVAAGIRVFAGGMHPASTATVLTDTGSGITETRGSHGGSTPQIGGFWIIDVANRDEALTWGRLAAVACEEPIEVRAFHDGPAD